MYQENLLVEPGGIELKGVPIDLGNVKTPSFMISTREDHIAPWKATYAATQLFSGPIKFVLAASGHIAGVVNPPAAEKYSYWTNGKNPATPETWFANAREQAGSWWPEWAKWAGKHGDGKVKARTPGDGKLKVIEDAPGSYANVTLQD
jgi:polyhydroxyalkanoate synthase